MSYGITDLTDGIRTRNYLPFWQTHHAFSGCRQNTKVVYNTDKYLYCLLVSLYYHHPPLPVNTLYSLKYHIFAVRRTIYRVLGRNPLYGHPGNPKGVFWIFSLNPMSAFSEKYRERGYPARKSRSAAPPGGAPLLSSHARYHREKPPTETPLHIPC